jgi:hypothetical protein
MAILTKAIYGFNAPYVESRFKKKIIMKIIIIGQEYKRELSGWEN